MVDTNSELMVWINSNANQNTTLLFILNDNEYFPVNLLWELK